METGAITSQIDVAQVVLYAFWIFFALLILYIRREDRREGYPLIREPFGREENPGYLTFPYPKTFRLWHGGEVQAPRVETDKREFNMYPAENQPGAPYIPAGNPLLDGVGPGAYALRSDKPDLTMHGQPKIVPMRVANDFSIAKNDPDPRGWPVVGADGVVGGTLRDAWVDRAEMLIRYWEVEVADTGERVLLPYGFTQILDGKVKVESILGHQFASAPKLASPDQITLLEEEKVMAYYGGGILYADPEREEPLI
jgi:photosynthetic reaction center H subunit